MKKYRVKWTEEAVTDLEEIVIFILNDRVSAAKSIYNTIKEKCRQLNTYPESYRIVPELNDIGILNYREIIYPPYRIVYKLTSTTVYVIAIVDARRDFENFIFRRLLRD